MGDITLLTDSLAPRMKELYEPILIKKITENKIQIEQLQFIDNLVLNQWGVQDTFHQNLILASLSSIMNENMGKGPIKTISSASNDNAIDDIKKIQNPAEKPEQEIKNPSNEPNQDIVIPT